jgi:glycosyltransferase involved in cell wall biosynthesis
MRILVATQQWFPDSASGAARVAQVTSVGLAERGHTVVVMAPKSDQEPAQVIVSGVVVRRLIRRGWVLPQTATDVFETRRLIRAGADESFDVALGHSPSSVVGASAALPNTPIVYVFHASGVLEERFRRSSGLPLVDRARSLVVEPILLSLERAAADRACRIVVMSRYAQGVLKETQPTAMRRVSVVWGGVDIAEFRPAEDRSSLRRKLGIAPDQTVLLTVRRIVSRMGIDLLLSAVSHLRDRDPTIKLVVVGDGEMRLSLERERDRLSLSSHVVFLGRVPEPDLKSWYQAADLFVLPTVAYEGFGLVTAEALACGTPVVGTRVGATSEILDPLDPDLLAPTPTADGLIAAIELALNRIGPELRASCRNYAASRLAWGSALDRWEAALGEAAEMVEQKN